MNNKQKELRSIVEQARHEAYCIKDANLEGKNERD